MYLLRSIVDTDSGVAHYATGRIIYRMNETWMDRAKKRMKVLGKTQEDLKGPLGVKTRGAVGHLLTGRRNLSAYQATALAKYLECSIDHLLTGEGLEDTSVRLTPEQMLLLDLFGSLTRKQQKLFIQEIRKTKQENDELYEEIQQKRESAGTKRQYAATNHEVETPGSNQRREPPPPATVSVNHIQNPSRPEPWGSKKKPGGQHG